MGSMGATLEVPVNWNKIGARVDLPNINELPPTICLKMMHNFGGQMESYDIIANGGDNELYFPTMFPHWSIIRIFNNFMGPTKPFMYLYPDPLVKDCIAIDSLFITTEMGVRDLEVDLETRDFDLAERILYIYQIFVSLCHLRASEHAHLDLKLNNCLLVKRPNISSDVLVLADFGCCRRFLSSQFPLGNPLHQAPEIGEQYDKNVTMYDLSWADVWSVGVMIFELVQKQHISSENLFQGLIRDGFSEQIENVRHWAIRHLSKQMIQRVPSNRLDPKIGLAIVGLMLWGGLGISSEEFLTTTRTDIVLMKLQAIDETTCSNWLSEQRSEILERVRCPDGNPRLPLAVNDAMQLHFLRFVSPDLLFSAVK